MKRIKYSATIHEGSLGLFRDNILAWYAKNGRDLPWRKTRDPYAILVSEIMLHQTQVRTVLPVYETFLSRFPSVFDLAQAPLDEVKAITDPLGYKVRGRWLHRIAQAVVTEYDGRVPSTLDELLALPGIGRYTAGAVLSFAFGADAPILDTNVKRVVGRYFGVDHRAKGAETLHRLWSLAEAVIPPGEGAVFNQALMDMGALVCTAKKPACLVCPLASGCIAAGLNRGAAEEPVAYIIRAK